ncbi:uncharacterized protein J7T54_007640 [Emericellopsis cladophorae]|uniref:Kinetochore protein fta4 n=1 Tax=Emericellopsis cladophorae TaxID=2686198 RepID=A0A9Q0BC40_9HYPO|nr:uncharacterized protein J7T54_007640 [Emericellopsis cladophorae]KAI6778699.1 hypothetical protein J7T54_007640 [Emericellopsis cladophorae]
MAATPTVTQHKEAFINSQSRLLAGSVTPSQRWTASNERQSDGALDPRLVKAATEAVNTSIQEHGKRVYAPQANRALAEQIAQSYAAEADRKIRGEEEDEAEGIAKEVDLVNDKAIESLPNAWPSDKNATDHPEAAKRYADDVATLQALNEQRSEIRQRVEQLRRLQSRMEPLQATEAGQGIQENLVTRNGEVEKELERMRTLLVRVSGRLGKLSDGQHQPDMEPPAETRKLDIDNFLNDGTAFPR